MWEGCQSIGSGDDILYGKALRYKVNAEWFDEDGEYHAELGGFVAHVISARDRSLERHIVCRSSS